MTPVLSIESLTKRYGQSLALDNVNLTIHKGEIFALLGPNGAGKTTLIGAVCGLVRPTSGGISLFGIDTAKDSHTPKYRVGLVPQEINFDPFFTVREVLRIQQGYFGQKPDEARIDKLLSTLSLTSKADALTRSLSGGMKRRLLIAKALVHRPQLVFLDEPTAGVDVELRRDLWNYVRQLRNEGTTVVLTTHYLEEAEELADRVGVIDHGKLLLVEGKQELIQRLGQRHLMVTFAEPMSADRWPTGLPMPQFGNAHQATFTERHGTLSIAQVLNALYRHQLPISQVEIRQAKLEDIMLRVLKGDAPV